MHITRGEGLTLIQLSRDLAIKPHTSKKKKEKKKEKKKKRENHFHVEITAF
jgi:hypothetical protein